MGDIPFRIMRTGPGIYITKRLQGASENTHVVCQIVKNSKDWVLLLVGLLGNLSCLRSPDSLVRRTLCVSLNLYSNLCALLYLE